MPQKKWTSAGGVVLDSMRQPWKVYVCKPSNDYGPWCFPKGRVEDGDDLKTTALREVQEEAGVPAKLLPHAFIGTGSGGYSITHYFMMVRTGPVGGHDDEMEEVRCVTLAGARKLFTEAGNSRDIDILTRAETWLATNASPKGVVEVSSPVGRPINELHTNMLGKIFFTTVAAWLVGKAVNIKLRGSEEQVRAATAAMLASKKFQDELNRPGASVDSVMQKLGVKHMSATEFERVMGIPWPI